MKNKKNKKIIKLSPQLKTALIKLAELNLEVCTWGFMDSIENDKSCDKNEGYFLAIASLINEVVLLEKEIKFLNLRDNQC
jgi:hypothetical protein